MSETISLEQLKMVHKKVEEAREDETPYAIYAEEDEPIKVIGDANKTEVKKADYPITFRFELSEVDKDSLPEDVKIYFDKYVQFTVNYEDIYVNPRKDSKLVGSLIEVMPFMNQIKEMVDQLDSDQKSIEKKYNAKIIKKKGKYATTLKDEKKSNQMLEEYLTGMSECVWEVNRLYSEASETVTDALYNLVALLLDIDDFHADHMTAFSVIEAVMILISTNPQLVNETESLFGF